MSAYCSVKYALSQGFTQLDTGLCQCVGHGQGMRVGATLVCRQCVVCCLGVADVPVWPMH